MLPVVTIRTKMVLLTLSSMMILHWIRMTVMGTALIVVMGTQAASQANLLNRIVTTISYSLLSTSGLSRLFLKHPQRLPLTHRPLFDF